MDDVHDCNDVAITVPELNPRLCLDPLRLAHVTISVHESHMLLKRVDTERLVDKA
jgi:hypothetical protein